MRHFLLDSLETVFQGGAETRNDFAFDSVRSPQSAAPQRWSQSRPSGVDAEAEAFEKQFNCKRRGYPTLRPVMVG